MDTHDSDSESPSRNPSPLASTVSRLLLSLPNDPDATHGESKSLPTSQLLAYMAAKVYNRGSRLLALVYGLLCFCFFGFRAVVEGCIIKKPGQQFWGELVTMRNKLWDLSKPPPYDLKHAFLTLNGGTKLHYLTNNLEYFTQASGPSKTKVDKRSNLVILLHGWPDTCMLWNDVISRLPISIKKDTTLIALDLPGFGGSDGLPSYGPNQVINALFAFILAMRMLYFGEGGGNNTIREREINASDAAPRSGKVIIVAHDWGAVCGFKLAALAPQLADRFIICNSALPELAMRNYKQRWQTACKLFREWRRDFSMNLVPWKLAKPLWPLVNQLRMSSYIFVYNLPGYLARASISRCNLWALRFVSSIAVGYGQIMHTPKVIWHIASFLGPNILTCDTVTPDGQEYGETVHRRAREQVSAESLRFYREGLASKEWRMRDEHTIVLHQIDYQNYKNRGKRMVGTLKIQPPGVLNAPMTIVWGGTGPSAGCEDNARKHRGIPAGEESGASTTKSGPLGATRGRRAGSDGCAYRMGAGRRVDANDRKAGGRGLCDCKVYGYKVMAVKGSEGVFAMRHLWASSAGLRAWERIFNETLV